MAMKREQRRSAHFLRLAGVCAIFALLSVLVVWRAGDLQVIDNGFLQRQGDARYLRVQTVPAHRGKILDRNGEPLAISTPVSSVWANPREILAAGRRWPELAGILGMTADALEARLLRHAGREFVYLRRHVDPQTAAAVTALAIPGVNLQREYRRYYPSGEVSAHVVGFTNIDDAGQEGLELAYDSWLRGQPGARRVLRNRIGQVIEDIESISEPRPGKDLRLTIDRRIQYVAYRELKSAVRLHRARSGSAVVLDARTGEVLAMVNQPAFNPNDRSSLNSQHYRNRAVTDSFEPGSTMKPFTIAAALEQGEYRPASFIQTAPGYYRIGRGTIRDAHNYGRIDLTTIIEKSSNVGVSKVALSLPAQVLWQVYDRVGFGRETDVGLPGEVVGMLPDYPGWRRIEQATLSFGYGLSVTTLQLARAYQVFANHGRVRSVSLVRSDAEPYQDEQVVSEKTAAQVLAMMATVITPGGTGQRARVQGYRVAGKTGTVQKIIDGSYSDERYLALFAGIAPLSDPRLIMVVVIDEPASGVFYGGQVAAPVFSRVMSSALWLMGVPPDGLSAHPARIAHHAQRSRGDA